MIATQVGSHRSRMDGNGHRWPIVPLEARDTPIIKPSDVENRDSLRSLTVIPRPSDRSRRPESGLGQLDRTTGSVEPLDLEGMH